MSLATRLSGDKIRAARWWGEAKRILFQLTNDLQAVGVEAGWRSRTCFDKTIIKVGYLYGNSVIEIHSPFLQRAEAERYEPVFYILCLRNIDFDLADSFKIYSIKSESGAIVTAETTKTPTQFAFNLVDSDTGTAVGIIGKPTRIDDFVIRKDHVVSWGLDYEDWLLTQISGSLIWGMDITHEDRYLYTHPSPDVHYGTIFQVGFRMANSFRSTGGRSSFYSSPSYFPKLVDGNAEWTVMEHGTYASGADLVGKNNITLNAAKTYAESWGERICEQENASYAFSLDDGKGTVITNPFLNVDVPAINWLGKYSWPIIGTLNARKVPKVYSMKYENDLGTQTTEDYWTETLSYDETTVYPNFPYLTDYSQSASGSSITYWPIAAIGDEKFLYLKNTLTQEETGVGVETIEYSHAPGPEWGGEPSGSLTSDTTYDEDVTQEFYAGTVLIESLASTISKIYSREVVITPTGGYPIGTYSETITEIFEATYGWVEVLDYSNLDGNLIVIYKKITEEISWPYSYSESGVYSPPPSHTVVSSRAGTSTRKVEYYLATIIGGILTKRLLATFDGTCDTEDDASGEDGVGDRIYGVSCQMNKEYAVFSFNKETFDGTGANASDYLKAAASTAKIFNWFGDGLGSGYPLPYPLPLEDMNLLIETATPAWSVGKFCVGAIGIAKKAGEFGYSEFDNQTDIVAATGLLDILRRVE